MTWRKIFQALWLAGICLTVLISVTPSRAFPGLGLNDKAGHLAAYAVLGFFAVLSFDRRRPALLAGLSMIALGVVLETGQLWVPGRYFEVLDILADAAGVFLGIVLSFGLRTFNRGFQ